METQAERIGRKVSQLSAFGLDEVEHNVDILLEVEGKTVISKPVLDWKPHRQQLTPMDDKCGGYWYERNRTVRRKWYE